MSSPYSDPQLCAILAMAAFFCVLLPAAPAAPPFDFATVTKVENKVSHGERKGSRSVTRSALVSDIIRANNFLYSENDSRAEIQYPDSSLVRIGQNTVFSFGAESRTLSLDRGSLIFHIPKGSGGGEIKTPSLAAAITGTTGKVRTNLLTIIEGTVRLVPSGRLVHAGQFARVNADGSITIDDYDPATVNDDPLVFFPDLMPGFPKSTLPAIAEVEAPSPPSSQPRRASWPLIMPILWPVSP